MDQLIYHAVNKLSQTSNYYHNLNHTLEVVKKLYTYFDSTPEQIIAGWYHDVIYVPGNSDNEAQSVAFFDCASDCASDLSQGIDRKKVAYLIECTKINNHISSNDFGREANELMDCDLANFGSRKEIYFQNTINLLKENPVTSLEPRKEFLRKLIEKGYIFRTGKFKELFEDIALDRIKRDIEGEFDSEFEKYLIKD